jgi:hypothetical protein
MAVAKMAGDKVASAKTNDGEEGGAQAWTVACAGRRAER